MTPTKVYWLVEEDSVNCDRDAVETVEEEEPKETKLIWVWVSPCWAQVKPLCVPILVGQLWL